MFFLGIGQPGEEKFKPPKDCFAVALMVRGGGRMVSGIRPRVSKARLGAALPTEGMVLHTRVGLRS
jgi:hypothetical protein